MNDKAEECAEEIEKALLAWANFIGHVMVLPSQFSKTNAEIIRKHFSPAIPEVPGKCSVCGEPSVCTVNMNIGVCATGNPNPKEFCSEHYPNYPHLGIAIEKEPK